MNNKSVASAIYFASYVAALAVMWQAVRFCQGSIGAPVIDQLAELFGPADTTTHTFTWLAAWMAKIYHYIGGIGVWVVLGTMVKSAGWTIGRIVEVGFSQYREEVQDAERLAAIEHERDRRREARRRKIEAAQPKSGFSLTTLIIGIIIGNLF